MFRCPTWKAADLLMKHSPENVPIFVYQFSHPTRTPSYPECNGLSCHTAELPFVFNNLEILKEEYSYSGPSSPLPSSKLKANGSLAATSGRSSSPQNQKKTGLDDRLLERYHAVAKAAIEKTKKRKSKKSKTRYQGKGLTDLSTNINEKENSKTQGKQNTTISSIFNSAVQEHTAEEKLTSINEDEEFASIFSIVSYVPNRIIAASNTVMKASGQFFYDLLVKVDQDEALSETMASMWVNFGRTSNPNYYNVKDLQQTLFGPAASTAANAFLSSYDSYSQLDDAKINEIYDAIMYYDQSSLPLSKKEKNIRKENQKKLAKEIAKLNKKKKYATFIDDQSIENAAATGNKELSSAYHYAYSAEHEYNMLEKSRKQRKLYWPRWKGSRRYHLEENPIDFSFSSSFSFLGRYFPGLFDKDLDSTNTGTSYSSPSNSASPYLVATSTRKNYKIMKEPHYLNLVYEPEIHLATRECICDFWENIGYKY